MSIQNEIIEAYLDEGLTPEQAYQKWSDNVNNDEIKDLDGYERIQDFIMSENAQYRRDGLIGFLNDRNLEDEEISSILDEVEEHVANGDYYESYKVVLG